MTINPSSLHIPSNLGVMARLKVETLAEHDAIGATLGLTSHDLSRARYCQILKRFYGFYQPVEAHINSMDGWGSSGLDWEARRKVHLLAADLKSLGVGHPESLPVCRDLPSLGSVAAAFGCLYVLEGSTLGAQVISRHIYKTHGITPEAGGRFFCGYGSQTAVMWHAFKAALTECAVSTSSQNQAVTAAISTFQSLRSWCEEGLS